MATRGLAGRKERRDEQRRGLSQGGAAFQRVIDDYVRRSTPGSLARDLASLGVQLLPSADIVDAQRNYQDAAGAAREGRYADALGSAGWGLLSNMGLSEVSAPMSAIFAGVGAKTADLGALRRAEQMESAGADAGDIWRETGWGRGADGEWRFEIDDSASQLTPWELDYHGAANIPFRRSKGKDAFPMTVPQWMDHPDLEKAYWPDETSSPKVFYGDHSIGEAQYIPSHDEITMGPDTITSPDGGRATGLHELQHAVQEREGFVSGGSLDMMQRRPAPNPRYDEWRRNPETVRWIREYINGRKYISDKNASEELFLRKYQPRLVRAQTNAEQDKIFEDFRREKNERFPDLAMLDELSRTLGTQEPEKYLSPREGYRRLAGEVEARNVEKRRNMTAAERRQTPPWETEDIPRNEQIVRRR